MKVILRNLMAKNKVVHLRPWSYAVCSVAKSIKYLSNMFFNKVVHLRSWSYVRSM